MVFQNSSSGLGCSRVVGAQHYCLGAFVRDSIDYYIFQVCNLTPECMSDDSDDNMKWNVHQFDGRWQKSDGSAGGSRNFPGA